MKKELLIPDASTGKNNELVSSRNPGNLEAARLLFQQARDRLLSPGSWASLAGKMGAHFALVNKEGEELTGPAAPGDFIRIDLPGPGPASGDGYDWVKIRTMEIQNGSGEQEHAGIKVMPSPNPFSTGTETAHFLEQGSSSTFLIQRKGTEVSARYYGRNEKANTDVPSIAETVRNTMISVAAFAGLSEIQWKLLLDGLLEK